MQIDKKQRRILIFIGISALLIVASIFTGDVGVIGNAVIVAVFIIAIPLFLQRYSRFVWIKAVEEQFPNFIRDLADSKRSGMSFTEAISIASKSNYGKLTPDIKKMNNRLSWGTPFLRVMEIFGDSIKESRIINEALNIIKESSSSGGNVAGTLDAIARDMIMLKDAEAERLSLVRQHVLIMYGVFFMFLGIAIMIIQVMVPMISTQPESTAGAGFGLQFIDPCEGVGYFPCNFFSIIGLMLSVPEGITLYYTALFFTVVIIQGIFTGLIAGQLGENSIVAGGKHALIMVLVAIGVFIFLARTGLLPAA